MDQSNYDLIYAARFPSLCKQPARAFLFPFSAMRCIKPLQFRVWSCLFVSKPHREAAGLFGTRMIWPFFRLFQGFSGIIKPSAGIHYARFARYPLGIREARLSCLILSERLFARMGLNSSEQRAGSGSYNDRIAAERTSTVFSMAALSWAVLMKHVS